MARLWKKAEAVQTLRVGFASMRHSRDLFPASGEEIAV
jgi:hypothetical protein